MKRWENMSRPAECYEAVYAVYPEEAAYRLEALRCRLLAGEYEAARDDSANTSKHRKQTEVSEDDPLLATRLLPARLLLHAAGGLRTGDRRSGKIPSNSAMPKMTLWSSW